jgi:hypothetical protein
MSKPPVMRRRRSREVVISSSRERHTAGPQASTNAPAPRPLRTMLREKNERAKAVDKANQTGVHLSRLSIFF